MIGGSLNAAHTRQAYMPDTHESMLPLLYAGDESYGWSEGMRAVTHALLENVTLPAGPVVEVGCGGGQLLAELAQRYADRLVIGADLHPLALTHAQNSLGPSAALVQAALPRLPWQNGQVALLIALDVFDQEGVELIAAVRETYRLLASDGALVMRVSAHPRLYGAHDRAFHTGRRYTRGEVARALLQAGFAIQRLTYANTLLSLPVATMRLAQRWSLVEWQPQIYRQNSLHHAAAWLLRQEARWLHNGDLPWGLSLCAVARKP